MQREVFSPLAIDALGEMMNISLGSSATAVSNMLDRRVDITTPKVTVVDIDKFSIAEIEPAMGVEIKYVSGLAGSNIMLLKKDDIKVIVDILMGQESDEDEFELNELTISAVCEVMNQMMGASATALSDFLGYSVNISTPSPFEMDDFIRFKEEHLPQDTKMIVVIRFSLKIENQLESEFMNVISVELARNLLGGLGLEEEDILGPEAYLMDENRVVPEQESAPSNKQLSQDEIEKLLAGGFDTPSEPEPAPSNKQLSQDEIEKLLAGGFDTPSEPEPAPSNKQLSQDEIEKLLAGGFDTPSEPEPAPSNKQLSQDEIEKLLAGGFDTPSEPEPAPSNKQLSQDEIEKLLAGNVPAPQPQVQQPQPQVQPQMPIQPQFQMQQMDAQTQMM
ncbi:MAG: chemotaxis protein CheC, partial [Oscillospiraceae bacterium]|nr:chemotaxis protein CheC [Oscillospiraceae bacterium]